MTWENYRKGLDSASDFDIEVGDALLNSASQAIDQYKEGLLSGFDLLCSLRWMVNDADIKVIKYLGGPANQELHATDCD